MGFLKSIFGKSAPEVSVEGHEVVINPPKQSAAAVLRNEGRIKAILEAKTNPRHDEKALEEFDKELARRIALRNFWEVK